jgi:hypothetical protein
MPRINTLKRLTFGTRAVAFATVVGFATGRPHVGEAHRRPFDQKHRRVTVLSASTQTGRQFA